MPDLKIAIIDYGLGNIFSIMRAVKFLGHNSVCTADPSDIMKADRVILPGVGAFGDGMAQLKGKGLDRVLAEYAQTGKPVLGICLGMQLLFTTSEEFGLNNGLNLVPGHVRRIPSSSPTDAPYKIPHVGWNSINPAGGWRGTVLENNQPGAFFYFVHSYRAIPERDEHVLATTSYGSVKFCSVVHKDNIFGCQFHPELSGPAGLAIYRQFIHGHLGSRHKVLGGA